MLASKFGLIYDVENNKIHGIFRNYTVVIYAPDARYPYILSVITGATNGSVIGKDDIRAFRKSLKGVTLFKQTGNEIRLNVNCNNINKSTELLAGALNALVDFLTQRGFVPCCSNCGSQGPTVGYVVGGQPKILCESCGQAISRQMAGNTAIESTTVENVPAGIVGALLGSLVGALAIILISQLGYVSVLSGLLMGVCAVKGYELLAKKLSVKGVVISIVIMVIVTFFANRVDWGIEIYKAFGKEYDVSFFECFKSVGEFVREGAIEGYYGNLVLLDLFTLGGGIPTAIGLMKNKQIKNSLVRLSIPTMAPQYSAPAEQPYVQPVDPATPEQPYTQPVNSATPEQQSGINKDLF